MESPIYCGNNARFLVIKYYFFYYKTFNYKHLKRVGDIFYCAGFGGEKDRLEILTILIILFSRLTSIYFVIIGKDIFIKCSLINGILAAIHVEIWEAYEKL